ncbi:PREDICTED: probable carboxypeptidase PM20D1 [Calidris pugnax]|uniref:probable carboxypeptidase PM20D1 n=1 Tax=Calidris pugnax TaxID=198806 RepID=UPI00071D6ADB|nr:PREDICTED: probable carboxypeptidase PM20D1 [Calidris pugnax]
MSLEFDSLNIQRNLFREERNCTCVGNTDSRHFTNVTNAIYRFNPLLLKSEDLPRIHGLNERISVENYEKQVEFLFQLMKNCDTEKLPEPHANSHEL